MTPAPPAVLAPRRPSPAVVAGLAALLRRTPEQVVAGLRDGSIDATYRERVKGARRWPWAERRGR